MPSVYKWIFLSKYIVIHFFMYVFIIIKNNLDKSHEYIHIFPPVLINTCVLPAWAIQMVITQTNWVQMVISDGKYIRCD